MDHTRKFPRSEVHELPYRKSPQNSINSDYKKDRARVYPCKISESQELKKKKDSKSFQRVEIRMAMDVLTATLRPARNALSAAKFLLRVIYRLEAYIQSGTREE